MIYQKPIKVYEGSFNAGINGLTYTNENLEGKSFKISGSKLETTPYFLEDYDPNTFETNYRTEESPNKVGGPSNWIITPFPYEDN